jgi:hypothetical protein
MISYSDDCSYMKAVPMNSRSASEWLKSYEKNHPELTSRGFKPKLQTLDNEASTELKSFFLRMMWIINLSQHIVTDAMPQIRPFRLSTNVFSHD